MTGKEIPNEARKLFPPDITRDLLNGRIPSPPGFDKAVAEKLGRERFAALRAGAHVEGLENDVAAFALIRLGVEPGSLGRKAGALYFIKIVQGDNRVSHVALVRTAEDLRTIIPFLREAFDLAVSEES